MGASSYRKSMGIRTEALESRELLSAALIEFCVMPRGTFDSAAPSSFHVFAPIQIQNNARDTEVDWQEVTINLASPNGELAANPQSGIVSTPVTAAPDSDCAGGATSAMTVSVDAAAALQHPGAADTGSDREAYLASLTAANGTEVVVAAPTAPETGSQPTGLDNSGNNLGRIIRVHRGGKGVSPGDLHPGQGTGRGSGSTGSSGGGDAHDPSADVLLSTVPIGPAVTQSNQPANGAAGYSSAIFASASSTAKQAVGTMRAAISDADQIVASLAKVTFSVLPLAVAEMQSPTAAVNAPRSDVQPPTLTQQFISRAQAATAAIHAVDQIITSEALPEKMKLVNLFHVNALATFSDAMGAFIEESAAAAVAGPVRPVSSHAKAWKITAAVAAADVLLIAGWLNSRRAEELQAKGKKTAKLTKHHVFAPHLGLSPR